MKTRTTRVVAAVLCLLSLSSITVTAQVYDDLTGITWLDGPATGHLGDVATVAVPAGFFFTGRDGASKFMELSENPPNGSEVGVMMYLGEMEDGSDSWFILFSYDPSGHVLDDEKDGLEADAILRTIRDATERANTGRRERGWEVLQIEGWVSKPHYDDQTHNLTWALGGVSSEGRAVNHSVRLLGRGGVMHVDLVITPEHLAATLPAFDSVVSTLVYNPGHRYAEWRSGEEVASYGLTALVAGGAGAAAAETGSLAYVWKVLVGGVVAIAAVITSVFSRPVWRQRTGG